MEEKILLELEKLQEEKRKIEEEKNTAFDLLTRITEQKNEVEETIEQIQLRESQNATKEYELNLILNYIRSMTEEEVIEDGTEQMES